LQAVANKTTTEWFELELERAQALAQELKLALAQERELKLVRYTVPE